jgi:hypothetical protein
MRATRARVLSRAVPAAAAAVLAVGAVLATAGAASAASGGHGHAKPATTLHISNKPVAHNHHHFDVLTGLLKSHRKGVAGETITLESRTGPHRKWAVVGTGTTAADGSVSFTITAPAKTTQFEMVFAGDSAHRKSHSNVITIKK